MNKKFFGFAALAIILVAGAWLLRFGPQSSQFIWQLSNNGQWLLPLVSVAALVDSVNPCAFSVLLLTLAFLFSIGRLRSRILQIGGAYVLGIFLVYILIGLGILQVLHLFNTPHFMAKVGASLLIVLGLINAINEFFPSFPVKLRIPQFAHHKMAQLMDKASVPTVFLLGGLVGLCEFPCTGGPYLMVLGLLHDSATYYRGLSYLLLYNLIFILPLVLILLAASNRQFLQKIQRWQEKERRWMRLGGGVAMIILGLIIFWL